jgi:heat-inducible transcriptional repressor
MTLDPRREAILKCIVDEYIRSAEPVGSKLVAETYGQVSPATIRNDMAELEAAGYIAQPHTSAGRVPTEKAYVYYLQRFVKGREQDGHRRGHRAPQGIQAERRERRVREAVREAGGEDDIRSLARTLVDLSGEMAIVAADPRRGYYAGVANLFEKPDFEDLSVVRELSRFLDRFDEVVGEVFDRVADEPRVLIGSDNPFGPEMSAVMIKCRLPNGRVGILGILGPMRMDYERNIGLMEDVRDILDE